MSWLVGLLALPVHAAPMQADLAEEAQLHFNLGLQAYRERQFPTALAHLLQSNRLAPNPNTAFNVALCYDRLAQPAQAWRFYAASMSGDKGDEEAVAAMARLTPLIGRLSIDSDPPGARVYVERRDLGERGITPLVLALRPGSHKVIVERDGHEPIEFTRQLEAGDSDSVAIALNPKEVAPDDPGERRWARSTVSYGEELILVADPLGCTWLPYRGPIALSAGQARTGDLPAPTLAPGSRIAASADVTFALDVTIADRHGVTTTRSPLAMSKKGAHLADASAVRHWGIAPCPALGPSTNWEGMIMSLQTLPKEVRRATVAVMGELARAEVADAAQSCAKGDCRAFVAALSSGS